MIALVTRAEPQDVELAVPELRSGKSDHTLFKIAKGWASWPKPGSRTFERAVNAEYRDGPDGACVSTLYEGGTTWVTGPYVWPAFGVTEGNVPVIADTLPPGMKFFVSAGPRLLRQGVICDLPEELAVYRGYSGLMESSLRERAGIGIAADGVVVHVAMEYATLYDVAVELKQQGCIDAIALDGGGSMGVVDSSGKVLIGHNVRKVCSALIFKRVIASVEQPAAFPPSSLVLLERLSNGTRMAYFYSEKPSGKATPNFKWAEFASKRTGRVFIAEYLVEMCQYIRTKVGGPVVINSAYRDVVHNAAVGGAPDSYHVYGMAVDVSAIPYGADRIIRAARDYGWRGGLGRYSSFVHFDLGPERTWAG